MSKLIQWYYFFLQNCEINGTSYIQNSLRTSAILNIENDDKYCVLWSILAKLYPCNNIHSTRVITYRKNFDELNIERFDITNWIKCSDVHRFEKLNKLSTNIFELNFSQNQNKWRLKLIPIEVSKNESDRVIDLLIYKNHQVLNKKLQIVFGNRNFIYVCRRCLNSYTSQNVLIKHKQHCSEQDKTSLRLSNESQLNWKKSFSKKSIIFPIICRFSSW